MHTFRPQMLLGAAIATSVLYLAGCAAGGAGNEAARCGGRAYDSVMFNTDQYDTQERVRVASALRDAVDGEVTDDILRRIVNVTGNEGSARRIADEFRTCLVG